MLHQRCNIEIPTAFDKNDNNRQSLTIGYIPNFNNKYPFSKKIGQKSFPTSCVTIICINFATKIMQIGNNIIQTSLDLLLRCSFSY